MAKSTETITRTWLMDNAGIYAEYTATGGTQSLVDTGASISVASATNGILSFAAIQPYELSNLKNVEFLFNCTALEAATEFCVGVTDDATDGDIDTNINNGAYVKLAGAAASGLATVKLNFATGGTVTSDIATTSGFSARVGTDEWSRVRLDFVQRTQTVGPPGSSKGLQVTASISDNRGFTSRLESATALDLSASTASVAPFASVISGGNTVTSVVKMIRAQYRVPTSP